jgi:hypothetical protein
MVTEDKDQHLLIGRARGGEAFTYYAGAGWTRSGDFAVAGDWTSSLERLAQNLRYPLEITAIYRQ